MTIEVCAVSKQYELKNALSEISVTFAAGKIHALVGDNGAGKSTLAQIISGNIRPSAGRLLIDGEELSFKAPREALKRGIVIVQQRPLLADSLNALENITLQLTGGLFMGDDADSSMKAAVKKALEKLPSLRDSWAPELSLTRPVLYLGGARRFYTAFLGALLLKPKFLILDEPSAFLDKKERESLYARLREAVSKKNMTVLVITHSGAEAETYADTVTLLQRSRLQAHYETASDYHGDSSLIKGGGQEFLRPTTGDMKKLAASLPHGNLFFALEHVSARPKNKSALLDAMLAVYHGQITIVTGMREAALDTLEDVVTGMCRHSVEGSARFSFLPSPLNLARTPITPRFLRKHQVAIVPSDRTFRGSNPELTIEQMLTVYLTGADKKNPKDYARQLISIAGVQISPQDYVKHLSGGMLQRLILTRELATNPDCIIFCNPLQGLDKKGQGKMIAVAMQLAEQGKAVLILGDADFPLSLCHHVYTLESGICSLSYTRGTP